MGIIMDLFDGSVYPYEQVVPALVVLVIEECWNVKNDAQNRLKKE